MFFLDAQLSILLLILGISVGISCFWGWAANKIIKDKGYTENWFFWGFFFHFWAVLVAACKRENPAKRDYNGLNINMQYYGPSEYNPYANIQNRVVNNPPQDAFGSASPRFAWKCYRCGTFNESYVQMCRCGVTKIENVQNIQM